MDQERIRLLRQKAGTLPPEPGVYLMKNSRGEILYIGKAKKLKTRVVSYFRAPERHPPKVRRMVEQVRNFDYIVTDSEFEALVLECSLIKQHEPKYNILLKDDRGYHYIRISDEPYPRISAALQRTEDGAAYLGPYMSSQVIRRSVDEANRIFRLPTCRRRFPEDFGKERPCLNFHIRRCMGVCSGTVPEEVYADALRDAVDFLRGGRTESVSRLRRKMEEASDALEFERAARYRDSITALERMSDRQKVVFFPHKSLDALGTAEGDDRVFLSLLVLREGRLRDKKDFVFDRMEGAETVITEFLFRYYTTSADIPAEVFLDRPLRDLDLLNDLLRKHHGRKVELSVPERGDGRRLAEMAQNNAAQEMARGAGRNGREISALTGLGRLLGLKKPPSLLEAFDISNYGGDSIVGGMTVFAQGRPLRSRYRKFIIRGQHAPDDCAAMREMLDRRLCRYEAAGTDGGGDGFGELPDLWLVDGGAGQVSAAEEVLRRHGLSVPVFGMVKDRRHRTRAVRGVREEIMISADRNVFRLVTEIQDETHRYVISFSRKKHRKDALALQLTEIPGIGAKRAAGLLKTFGTTEKIRRADIRELASAPGMNAAAAAAVLEHYRGSG